MCGIHGWLAAYIIISDEASQALFAYVYIVHSYVLTHIYHVMSNLAESGGREGMHRNTHRKEAVESLTMIYKIMKCCC